LSYRILRIVREFLIDSLFITVYARLLVHLVFCIKVYAELAYMFENSGLYLSNA
jgi:hypothetical protein